MKGRTPALLVVIAFFAGAGTAHAQFTVEGSPYATGLAPYMAFAADFNRDGRQDVATSNGDGQTVSVFLRQAGGGFAEESGSPFSLPGATSNGAAGDFNGDGLTDLAIADFIGTSGVVIALRNAAGGFQRETVSLGGRLSAVGAGDFNGDSRVDLVVAAYDFAQVSVLLRNPSNDGFTLAENHAVGVQPRQIAVADFNGDGRPDIAVTNELSNSVSILANTGGGTFASEGVPVAVGTRPNGITAGDFDGDGRTDLAVANFSDSTVSILLRTAIGTFTAAGSPVAVGGGPAGVAGADFDGNGSLDIAVSTISSLDVIRRGAAGFARDTTTPITTSGTGLALADYNADGRADAAVSSIGSNLLTVLLSPSPPPAQPPPPTPTPTPVPTPDTPRVNREVNVLPVSGTVRIKRRGSSRYVELKTGEQIPNGSSVDARDGRVTIVAAQSSTRVERADFFEGLFTVTQSRRLTTLTLTEQLDCSRGGKANAAQKRKPKTRKLWGDGKGKFRTKGSYSAATVRGTRWLVTDGCTFTRTRVAQGSVFVRDDVRKRTVIVRKGKSYTARARR